MAKQRQSRLQAAILAALEEKPLQRYAELATTVAERLGRILTAEMQRAKDAALEQELQQELADAEAAGNTELASALRLAASHRRAAPLRRRRGIPDPTFRVDFSRSLKNLEAKGLVVRFRDRAFEHHDGRWQEIYFPYGRTRRSPVKWVALPGAIPEVTSL